MFYGLKDFTGDANTSDYTFNGLNLSNPLYSFNNSIPQVPALEPDLEPTVATTTNDDIAANFFRQGILGQETSGGNHTDSKGRVLVGRYKDGSTPKGPVAYGGSQMLLPTARMAAKKAGIDWDKNRFLTDPDYNKNLGEKWFTYLYNRYGGDTSKAAAAYHAGEGNVNSAIRAARAAGDPSTWLDILHAREGQRAGNENYRKYSTKDYVTKVTRYARQNPSNTTTARTSTPAPNITPDFNLGPVDPVTLSYSSDPAFLLSQGAREGDIAFDTNLLGSWAKNQMAPNSSDILGGLANPTYGAVYDKLLAPPRITPKIVPASRVAKRIPRKVPRRVSLNDEKTALLASGWRPNIQESIQLIG